MMIRQVEQKDIKECVEVIAKSFMTVADEFGFTMENAPRFTAFATTEGRINWHLNRERRNSISFLLLVDIWRNTYDNGRLEALFTMHSVQRLLIVWC